MSLRAAFVVVLALAACSDPKPAEETTAPLTSSGVDPDTTTDAPTSTDAVTGSTGSTSSTSDATSVGTSVGPTDPTSGETSEDTTAGTTAGTTADTTAATTGTTTGTTGTETTTGGVGDPCEGDAPRVLLTTTLGDMVVELDAVGTPVTTANFLAYVQGGFYDGTVFHRVIDGFVIQGGGYTADMVMKPTDPPIDLEIGPLKHVDGAISMARTNDPNSATSQFFICDGPQDFLNDQYAVFGVLVEGFDVLAAISAVATDGADAPVEDVIVTEAKCVP